MSDYFYSLEYLFWDNLEYFNNDCTLLFEELRSIIINCSNEENQ